MNQRRPKRALRLLLLVIVMPNFLCRSDDKIFQNRDSAALRRDLLLRFPTGQKMDAAREFLEKNDFDCTEKNQGEFLNSGIIDYIYCDRAQSEGFFIALRIQIALVRDQNGQLADILVSEGLIGP